MAESGGIRAAARRLGLTQPAVTHAVRELEQGLGVDLFVRSAKGVRLTAPGEALLLRTQRILHEAQSALSLLRATDAVGRGPAHTHFAIPEMGVKRP